MKNPVWFFLLLLIYVSAGRARAVAQVASATADAKDVEPVVHALCGKRIALLGESPVHGFGETLQFKVELVRHLIEECHYNALFMESGIYDYINIEKKLQSGQDVTESMISAAIGGLWANQEVQSLIPFLREEVKAGSLRLGGLDDQIGRGSYASTGMAYDLANYLQTDERSRCAAILQRHLLWQYTSDNPYGPSDKAKVIGCLDEIEARASQGRESQKTSVRGDMAMVESLKRNLARNFTEDDFAKGDQEIKWFNDRDRSMYLNFKWLFSQLSPRSKVIVWAATVHVAKDLGSVPGFEGKVPLGSYIRRDFGNRAFSLGFSAYSGDYAFVHQPIRRLSVAPNSSLEGRLFPKQRPNTVYLSRKELKKYGSIAARPLGITFIAARWDQLLDGLVIFRKERSPVWLNR